MKVASKLTLKGTVKLLLITGLSNAVLCENASLKNSNKYIVRLKDTSLEPNGSYTAQDKSHYRKARKDRLVKFRNEKLSRKKTSLLAQTGFLVTEELSESELSDLKNNPEVAYIEQDIIWSTQDFDAGDSDALPSSLEQSPWLNDIMGFDEEYPDPYIEPNFSKKRIIVAVIDTGTRIDHPFLVSALEPNTKEINGVRNRDDDLNGFVDDTYGANAITKNGSANEVISSHGTHVSGIIKAVRDQALSEFDEAQQVSILPIRFIGDDGSGSTATAIAALEYAASRGARVVNASWGAKGQAAHSQALFETFASLYENNDIFFSVAAGNADASGPNDNDEVPHFPANFNIPSLMSVASITPIYENSGSFADLINIRLSSFSNFGKNSVHIAAPGSLAVGRGSAQGILSANSDYSYEGDLYVKKQGTSMAAPVIAGIAAVMRAVNPELSSYEIKQLLIKSSKKQSSLSSIQNAALVQGRDAILLANRSIAQGTKPPVSANTSNRSTAQRNDLERTSGCGTITNNGSGSNPFGGNSLGLLSCIYTLLIVMRRLKHAIH